MNRKIKFRIWDKELKEMHDDLRLYDIVEDDFWYDGETDIWSVFYDGCNEQKRFIVMKYSGLKDKNGKEIYEGDIIEYKDSTGLHRETVVFDKGCFYAGWHSGSSTREAPKLINTRISKVIGNIYESDVFE